MESLLETVISEIFKLTYKEVFLIGLTFIIYNSFRFLKLYIMNNNNLMFSRFFIKNNKDVFIEHNLFKSFFPQVQRKLEFSDFGITDELKLKYFKAYLSIDLLTENFGIYENIDRTVNDISRYDRHSIIRSLCDSFQERNYKISEKIKEIRIDVNGTETVISSRTALLLKTKLEHKKRLFEAVFDGLEKEKSLENMLKRFLNEYALKYEDWILYLEENFRLMNGELSGSRIFGSVKGQLLYDSEHSRISVARNFGILFFESENVGHYDLIINLSFICDSIIDFAYEYSCDTVIFDLHKTGRISRSVEKNIKENVLPAMLEKTNIKKLILCVNDINLIRHFIRGIDEISSREGAVFKIFESMNEALLWAVKNSSFSDSPSI